MLWQLRFSQGSPVLPLLPPPPESSGEVATPGAAVEEHQSALDSQSTTSADISCDALTTAVIATTGQVIVNSGAKVDSYQSAIGPYGGTNVGPNGRVRSAGSIIVNGGIINGEQIANSPAQLGIVPISADARNLPLGAATPGDLNINTASNSISLAPGAYVVNNLNVNFPGAISIKPTGRVQIWVKGNLNLGGNENLNGIPGNLTFLVNSSGWINVNSGGQLFGTIYAPTSGVNLNSPVFGSVVGSSVTLNSGAAVHFDRNRATCSCPLFFEAESQSRSVSAGANSVVSDAAASGGKLVVATPPIDGYVDYQISLPATGTYSVKIRYSVGPARGRWKVMFGGQPLSGEVDAYSPTSGYAEVETARLDLSLANASPQPLRFVVTGKNNAAAATTIAIDRMQLQATGCRFEAESAQPSVAAPDSQVNVTQTQASGGVANQANLDAVGDSVRYTFHVDQAGEYRVFLRYLAGPNRGTFQAKLDDTTALGDPVDAYAVTPAFITQQLGYIQIPHPAELSDHTIRLTVTGKNASSTGFGITTDYLEVRFSPTAKWTRAWADAPLRIRATRDGTAGTSQPSEATSTTPVTFTIPKRIPVRMGNAGNGQFDLKFKDSSGTIVTCTYRGGSRTSHATTDLDRALGLQFLFKTCSNGAVSGQAVNATWVQGNIVSSDDHDIVPKTAVSLDFGGGCSEIITSDISPAEVVALRQDFKWTGASALAEKDPDGHPAMWHGLIYIESKTQLAALDRWRVFWSAMPLTKGYMAKWTNKCGRVEHATDGIGVVVYAVFPAHLFNMIRNAGINAEAAGVTPPFAFIMPTTPNEPGLVNSDGSLSYAGLASPEYVAWLKTPHTQQPFLDLPSWDDVKGVCGDIGDGLSDGYNWCKGKLEDGGDDLLDYANKGWDAFVDWAANNIDNAWEGIQRGLQEIALVFQDKQMLRLDLRILNRDPLFAPDASGGRPDFVRAWGPTSYGARPKVFPVGAQFRVRQWGLKFLPVMDQTEIPGDGHVELEMLAGGSSRSGGLCVELEADYGSITSDLIPNEVCDLYPIENFGGSPAQVNAPQGVLTLRDDSYEGTLTVDQADIYGLTQIYDSSEYVRQVIGHEPASMDVLTGSIANDLTSALNGRPRAMTLCLNFPSMGATLVSQASVITATYLFSPLILKNSWWPDAPESENTRDSRAVMTHEYGHFAMCSMMFDEDNAAGLRGLVERVGEVHVDRDSEVALMTESFADNFSLQVAGGVNYIRPDNGATSAGTVVSYCTASPCMDENYTGSNDYVNGQKGGDPDFHDELAKWESIIYDAFDSSDPARRLANAPSNGDLWVANSSNLLVPSTGGYIVNEDDPVALPGSAWRTWITKFLARGKVPNKSNVIGGLMDAIGEQVRVNGDGQHYDWCDKCEVLAPHFASTPASALMRNASGTRSFDIRSDRWMACISDPEMSDLLGPAPESHGALNASCKACPPLQHPDANGTCTPCPPGQRPHGRACDPCTGSTIPGNDNEYHSCPAGSIAVAGACVACGIGKVADPTTNLCVDCVADAVVDWGAGSAVTTCTASVSVAVTNTGLPDNCPNEFWLELRGVDHARALPLQGLSFAAIPEPVSQAYCSTMLSELTVYSKAATGAWTQLGAASASGSWIPGPCQSAGVCTPASCDANALVSVDFASPAAASASVIRAKARSVGYHGAVAGGVVAVTGNTNAACVP